MCQTSRRPGNTNPDIANMQTEATPQISNISKNYYYDLRQGTIRARGVSVPVCGCARTRRTRTAGRSAEPTGTGPYGYGFGYAQKLPQKPVPVLGPYPWVPRADSAQFYGSGSVKPGTIHPATPRRHATFLKKFTFTRTKFCMAFRGSWIARAPCAEFEARAFPGC